MIAGYPITIFFIFLVMLCNIYNRNWSDEVTQKIQSGEITGTDTYQAYIPVTINAVLIVLFEKLYFSAALMQCKLENHKYESQYDNSLILKVFSFYFINSNASNFIYAFYSRNQLLLAQNLATILIFKQIVMNLVDYVSARLLTGRKLHQMEERYEEAIEEERQG